MPVLINKTIPAFNTLSDENIFVMTEDRGASQDIRPIEIAILNLMPTKQDTETQLMRLLSNSPLQINVTLITTASYRGTHTDTSYLDREYVCIDEIQDKRFDGMIVTGAPVENLDFEDVLYWDEMKRILAFTETNVTSTIYICWGAQAALYHFYGIQKKPLDKKLFGVFPQYYDHTKHEPLLKGMDDIFYMPHSRKAFVSRADIDKQTELDTLAYFYTGEPSVIKSKDGKKIFITGHIEYDRYTLRNEYIRDVNKGLPIDRPEHYFLDSGVDKVNMNWASAANLIYCNWLNYYVYQITPFDLEKKQ